MNKNLPYPDTSAEHASLALQEQIANEIQSHNNWISFNDYMQMALFTPSLGYYTGGSHKIGSAGDFVTAPSMTPLFGLTLARQLAPLLQQTAGNVYEFGAGTGELAVSLLIKNGMIVTSEAEFKGDILVEGEKITAIGKDLKVNADETVNAEGLVVLPGGVDEHTHFNFTFKTASTRMWETSNAALAGGFSLKYSAYTTMTI